jgi:hypothetical protein
MLQLSVILQSDCGAGILVWYLECPRFQSQPEDRMCSWFLYFYKSLLAKCLTSAYHKDYYCFLTRYFQLSADNSVIWLYTI